MTPKDETPMKKKKLLKGSPLNLVDMNLAMYGCTDPDFPPISSHIRENIPPIALPTTTEIKGQIIIVGTPEETGEDKSGFAKLWNK